MSINLVPLNDLVLQLTPKTVDPATGLLVSVTTGTLTAFLATTNAPTAVAADPSLSVTGTHIGNGKWLVTFDATVLTAALLAGQFGSATPYCIVQMAGGFRRYITLTYTAQLEATVT